MLHALSARSNPDPGPITPVPLGPSAPANALSALDTASCLGVFWGA